MGMSFKELLNTPNHHVLDYLPSLGKKEKVILSLFLFSIGVVFVIEGGLMSMLGILGIIVTIISMWRG